MTALCRRTLLKGAAATCGTGLLAACGGAEQAAAPPAAAPPAAPTAAGASAAAPAPGGLRVTLGQVSDIPVGGALSVKAPGGATVLLTQPEEGKVEAFSAVCPHEGCAVGVEDDGFGCPCHGSQFELDGSLRRGPARTGLAPYDVQVVDGQVLPA